MRLHKFEIRNFKGIEEGSFEWDDLAVLIGENNAGKSTVLQALQWFLGGAQIKDPELFLNHLVDSEHAIELVGSFDQLSDHETQMQAVRGRMHEGQWIIKKRFWCERAIDEESEGTWKELYYSYSSEEAFLNWPENEGSWRNFSNDYQELIDQIPNRVAKPTNATRDALRELVRQQKPQLLNTTEPSWVPNPGGGGNWKSNANSMLPRFIFVRAVHDATDEAVSKDASSYGRIVGLIVEKKLMQRPEVQTLKESISNVLKLFNPDPDHPEMQAEEIREVQRRINERLNEVISGIVSIRTAEMDVQPLILPNTSLILKDGEGGVPTSVGHQGHGLQRTLVMTLLQVLAEIQTEPDPTTEGEQTTEVNTRPVVLAIEEPELYMHPQMERRMRDTLYRLASQPGFQVICTTHSPVFLDMARRHKSIVRVVKASDRRVAFFQVSQDIFTGEDAQSDKDRLNLIAQFHPTVNELFFAKRVVLFEERSALAAFKRAAELTGLFQRHPNLMHNTTLVDCVGKPSIPGFQRVLNYFMIPYTVVHDEDSGNPTATALNAKIEGLLERTRGRNNRHMISPTNLEGMLGHTPKGTSKLYQTIKRVEELHSAGALPAAFIGAMNWVYLDQDTEPPVL